jgi:hypothetical protein
MKKSAGGRNKMDRRITTFAVLAMMWLGLATVALRVVEPVVHSTPKTGLERLFAQRLMKPVAAPQAPTDSVIR